LGLTSQLQTAEKAVYAHCMRKKQSGVFASEIEILLLSKNLTDENFI